MVESLGLDASRAALLERYFAAVQRVEAADSELNSARCERSNAINALGKVLVPNDAKPEERFSIWIGSKLLEIVIRAPGNGGDDYTVRWRKA